MDDYLDGLTEPTVQDLNDLDVPDDWHDEDYRDTDSGARYDDEPMGFAHLGYGGFDE